LTVTINGIQPNRNKRFRYSLRALGSITGLHKSVPMRNFRRISPARFNGFLHLVDTLIVLTAFAFYHLGQMCLSTNVLQNMGQAGNSRERNSSRHDFRTLRFELQVDYNFFHNVQNSSKVQYIYTLHMISYNLFELLDVNITIRSQQSSLVVKSSKSIDNYGTVWQVWKL